MAKSRIAALAAFALVAGLVVGVAPLAHATVSCTGATTISGNQVTGSTGNDTIDCSASTEFVTIFGLDGDDVIIGTNSSEGTEIHGGPGNDTLAGGPFSDEFRPGLGDDLVDGEGGLDRVNYISATGPVKVNLARDKATGEGTDLLVSIEDAGGSSFDDTLKGDEFSNILDGSFGDDTLVAGGGDDEVSPGDGEDVVRSGRGDDFIGAEDGFADAINANGGNDTCDVDGLDTFRGCEVF